nr:hypothetical protein 1634Bnrm2_p021 [Cryptomonas sp.]
MNNYLIRKILNREINFSFQSVTFIRFYLRCMIRNRTSLSFNWEVLSMIERYSKNFVISRDITNLAFFFCLTDNTIFYKFIRYGACFLKSNSFFFLKQNPYNTKIWLQIVLVDNRILLKRKKILSSLHFIPYCLVLWKINNILNGFGFSIFIKNKNHSLQQKEVLIHFKLLELTKRIKTSKLDDFNNNFFRLRYLLYSTWVWYLKYKKNFIIEKNVETNSLSNILISLFFYQKINSIRFLLTLKRKNSTELLFSRTFRIYSDLDNIIDECFFENVNNKKITFFTKTGNINSMFNNIYYKGICVLLFSLRENNLLEFYLSLESFTNYHPYSRFAKHTLNKFYYFPKNYFVYVLKFITINSNTISVLYREKFLQKIKNYKHEVLSKCESVCKFKIISNVLSLQGLCEKNKEFVNKLLQVKKLKLKFLKRKNYIKCEKFLETENIKKQISSNRALVLSRFLIFPTDLFCILKKFFNLNYDNRAPIEILENKFDFKFAIVFFFIMNNWLEQSEKKCLYVFLMFAWIIYLKKKINMGFLLKIF